MTTRTRPTFRDFKDSPDKEMIPKPLLLAMLGPLHEALEAAAVIAPLLLLLLLLLAAAAAGCYVITKDMTCQSSCKKKKQKVINIL